MGGKGAWALETGKEVLRGLFQELTRYLLSPKDQECRVEQVKLNYTELAEVCLEVHGRAELAYVFRLEVLIFVSVVA